MSCLRLASLATAAALLLTTACSDDGDDTPSVAPTPTVNCADPHLSMDEWTRNCGPGSGNTAAPPQPPRQAQQLGQPAITVGEKGLGVVELTPTTVVYAPRPNTDSDPSRTLYAIVTIKENNTGAIVAEIPLTSSWNYVAPDGEAIATRTVAVLSSVSFGDVAGVVQPGTFRWGYTAWAIRPDQRGGVFQHTDGAGLQYRWQLPAEDTGPQIAEVKSGLG